MCSRVFHAYTYTHRYLDILIHCLQNEKSFTSTQIYLHIHNSLAKGESEKEGERREREREKSRNRSTGCARFLSSQKRYQWSDLEAHAEHVIST